LNACRDLEIMSTKKSLVSIIVLNWNGKRFLGDCLGSLFQQDYLNYEVLFVDNGSTDDSLRLVRDIFGMNPKLRIIALKKNYNFSKGNNIGITHAQGKYVIVLNNDTRVKQNFISELVKVAESDDQIASVGCKILSMNGDTWFSQKFTNGGFIVPIFLQTLLSERITDISGRHCVNLANSGCVSLFRKKVLNEIGGFDEDFVADWEDWDLGYRINLAGYKSVHIPIPLVFHVGGGTAGHLPERYVRIYRNTLFAHFKNYEHSNLLTRFAVFFFVLLPLSHVGFIIRMLFFGGQHFKRNEMLGYFLSLIKGYRLFLSELNIYSKKRYTIQKLRTVSDKQIFSSTKLEYIL